MMVTPTDNRANIEQSAFLKDNRKRQIFAIYFSILKKIVFSNTYEIFSHLEYFLACETSRDKKRTQWNSLLLKFLRFCGKTKRSLIIPSIFGGEHLLLK